MINEFQNENRFLSNFFPAEVEFEGILFPSSEHAYVAAKSLDIEFRKKILSMTPGQAKRAGRQIEIRPDWEQVKLEIMEKIVRDKFNRNKSLGQKLIKTGNQMLIEGNTWGDTFWGMCKGRGQNHLGKILMKIRAELNS